MTSHFVHLARFAVLSVAVTLFTAPTAAAQSPAVAPAIAAPALLSPAALARLVKPLSATVAAASLSVPPAIAQTQEAKAIAAAVGEEVSVLATDGSRYKGTFTSLSTTEVVFVQAGNSRRLPLTGVQEVRRESHVLRNSALIGLAAGAGFGLVVCASDGCSSDDGSEAGMVTLMFTGMGAGAGALVGAVMSANSAGSRTIYKAPRKTTMTLAPALGRKTVGVTGQVRW